MKTIVQMVKQASGTANVIRAVNKYLPKALGTSLRVKAKPGIFHPAGGLSKLPERARAAQAREAAAYARERAAWEATTGRGLLSPEPSFGEKAKELYGKIKQIPDTLNQATYDKLTRSGPITLAKPGATNLRTTATMDIPGMLRTEGRLSGKPVYTAVAGHEGGHALLTQNKLRSWELRKKLLAEAKDVLGEQGYTAAMEYQKSLPWWRRFMPWSDEVAADVAGVKYNNWLQANKPELYARQQKTMQRLISAKRPANEFERWHGNMQIS